MIDGLFTTKEVANELEVAYTTVTTYVRKGVLIPYACRMNGRGTGHLFNPNDVTNMKASRFHKKTSRGRSAYIKKTINCPTKDDVLPNGSIIYWSRFVQNGDYYVPVRCGGCGVEFQKNIYDIMAARRKGELTGCCKNCYGKYRKLPIMPSNGRIRKDGYIYRYKRTFTEEEWENILKPMRRGNYVQEHRAVMALHLGRPLETHEVIHHLNGDKFDNRLSNLQIFDNSKHSRLHAKSLRRQSVLRKRIAVLEQLLRDNGIEVPD